MAVILTKNRVELGTAQPHQLPLRSKANPSRFSPRKRIHRSSGKMQGLLRAMRRKRLGYPEGADPWVLISIMHRREAHGDTMARSDSLHGNTAGSRAIQRKLTILESYFSPPQGGANLLLDQVTSLNLDCMRVVDSVR